MAKKDERYLNVTLKNEQEDKDEVVISLSGIFKKFKKFFALWLVAAIVVGILTVTISALFTQDQHKTLTALVSFTYDGIEDGRDPSGNEFDPNSLKTPAVIEAALTELNLPLEDLESIRSNIRINGLIPQDAYDRIVTYKNVYENAQSGALSAAEAMLDVDYYPTQYQVVFNYAGTEYDADDAVQVFNTVLECYRDYFFDTYGYNRALGSAVTAINYTDYDYAEAVDVFSSSLSTLQSYVGNLSSEDTTRFRSAATGYTFADLSEAIKTIKNMDLDIISSYITINNVTKDKDSLINYYDYRIETLKREKTIAEEKLAVITESINSYVKDEIFIFGNGTDTTDTQSTVASEQYDALYRQRINVQSELSTATQQINFYTQRKTELQRKPVGTDAEKERVEGDLAKLNEKITDLIEKVNLTADEYYETVTFANAYNILVPASSSATTTVKNVIKDSIVIALILEALLFVAYICVAFVTAIIDENKKKAVPAVAAASDDDDDDDEDDDSDSEETTKKSK